MLQKVFCVNRNGGGGGHKQSLGGWARPPWPPRSDGTGKGAVFAFSAKFGFKSTKNRVFWILCMPMGWGGYAPPRLPGYATEPGSDLLYGTVPGVPYSDVKIFFWSSPVFFQKMLQKPPWCQRYCAINLARTIKWLVSATIHHIIFQQQFTSTLPVFTHKKKKKIS